MANSKAIAAAGLAALSIGSAAGAADPPPPPPAVITAVEKCRSETSDPARLRCYDAAAAALGAATAAGSIVVLDRDAVRRTRRSLFGFDLPDLPFFGDDDDGPKESEAKIIVAKVKSAREAGYHMWMVELDTGAVWQTTESTPRLMLPRKGEEVTIRKSPGGGYMLDMGQRRIRAKRVR